MDTILLNTSLSLPAHLKLPAGLSDPNVVFTNMGIHTSTICLHQAAIFKAEKNKLPASVSSESKARCITAANEIASIMRTISHMDLSAMNPFISCLYVASRVFVQNLKSRPDDVQTTDSLRFLLSAMSALKRRNPLTESFLVQLDVDFEALAARIPRLRNAFPRPGDSPGPANAANPGAQTGGPACNGPEGLQGIMAYCNECHFMKMSGDDGNAAAAPDLVEPQADGQGPNSNDFGQAWLSADQSSSMPGLTPSSGTMYEKTESGGPLSGFGDGAGAGDNQDGRGPPEAGKSNGPTPNSSGAGSDGKTRLAPGPMGGPGQDSSFRASPLSPQQNMMGQGQGFFGDSNGFTMAHGMSGQQGGAAGFAMPSNGWADLNGPSTAMQPVGEGVLRALMNMGPMDAVDLSWDSGNDTHMRG